jgi:hypothetical protein
MNEIDLADQQVIISDNNTHARHNRPWVERS